MGNNYRIVVGVDGSAGGRRALLWAVHEAAARGGTVQAVNAWRADWLDLPPPEDTNLDRREGDAVRTLTREIEALPEFERARVAIATEAVEGRPDDVLTSAAQDANLLVLGSHGHGQLWHSALGSVSEQCIRKATCPVVVLPTVQEVPRSSAEPALGR